MTNNTADTDFSRGVAPRARRAVGGFEASELAIPGPTSLPAHSHPYASLSVLFLGGCRIEGGSRPEVISAPMAAYFPAGIRRTVSFRPGLNQLLWIRLPDALVAELPVTRSGPRGFVPFAEGRSQWLGSRLVVEMRRDDRASSHLLHGMLLELVGSLLRALSEPENGQPAWLERAMASFHDVETPLSVTEIARACGVHPTHFTRAFKQHVGCTPTDYLRQQRVSRARLLLTDTSRRLADIASECGFSDQAHLTREFKRVVGCTPARFRRQLGGG